MGGLIKTCSSCKESKESQCFSKDSQQKDGLSAYCRECRSKKAAAKYIANKDEILARNKKWSSNNQEKIREIRREYRRQNHDSMVEYADRWRKENAKKTAEYTQKWREKVGSERVLADAKAYREANREKTRAASLAWQKRNPGKAAANNAARYAAKLRATPAWSNLEKVAEFYVEAAKLALETGNKYDVDHVVPLRSKIVCGLHCEANLTILQADKNRSKGNRHWPDMPE